MNKPYLLIMGYNCYPEAGTGDWVGLYPTRVLAASQVEKVRYDTVFTKGKNKGCIKSFYFRYKVKGGEEKDWYQIVDLRDWENENE